MIFQLCSKLVLMIIKIFLRGDVQNKEGISKTLGYGGGLAFDFVFYNFVAFHASNAYETFPKPNAMVPGGFKNIFVKFSGV